MIILSNLADFLYFNSYNWFMKINIKELVGWYGTVAIVGAYALNTFGVIEADSLPYQLLNLTGAIGIVVISLQKKAYQPATLNAIWSVVAIIGILSIIF